VVGTPIAEMPIVRDMERAGTAFGTPTIIHFGSVLLSAVISAPWHGIACAAVLWGVLGLVWVVYVVIVARRMRVQSAYSPVFEEQTYVCVPDNPAGTAPQKALPFTA
jgi:hypothetical protein